MDPEELLKQIRAALGLPADASVEAVLAQCQKLNTGVATCAQLLGLPATTAPDQLATAAQTSLATLANALKVTGPATVQTLTTAAQKIGTQLATASQVDLTKYVPMDIYLATAGQLAKSGEDQAKRAVDEAITAGKIPPAMKDHWLAVASQNLAGFTELVGKMPVILSTASQTQSTQAPPTTQATGQQLTSEQLAIANQMGLSPDDYAKALAAEAK